MPSFAQKALFEPSQCDPSPDPSTKWGGDPSPDPSYPVFCAAAAAADVLHTARPCFAHCAWRGAPSVQAKVGAPPAHARMQTHPPAPAGVLYACTPAPPNPASHTHSHTHTHMLHPSLRAAPPVWGCHGARLHAVRGGARAGGVRMRMHMHAAHAAGAAACPVAFPPARGRPCRPPHMPIRVWRSRLQGLGPGFRVFGGSETNFCELLGGERTLQPPAAPV